MSKLRKLADFLLSGAEVHELAGPEDKSFEADSIPERVAVENGLVGVEKVKLFEEPALFEQGSQPISPVRTVINF